MKKLFTLVLSFLFLLSVSPDANATHVIGADITWKCLGNDSFLVEVNAYRDCNGISLTGGDINFSSISCITNTGFSVPATVSPAIDITNVCSSSCTRCSAPGCSFAYGYQKIVLSAIVYMGNQTCCNWRISFSSCCRNTNITTGPSSQNFNIFAEFDKCVAPCNNSPVFTEFPKMLLSTGECFIYNHGAIDPDGDSLVYSLTPPLQSTFNPVNYTSPYNYDRPLNFNGFPNPNLPWNFPLCRGFHLDPATGELKFKPVQPEITVMAVKVTEYRNGLKISETRRDIQLIVVNTPANNVPVLSGINNTLNSAITLCPGSLACFNITAQDADAADSIFMNQFGQLPGATFSFNYNSSNSITATVCWTPQQQHVRTTPYTFVLEVEDQACPIPAFTSRPYQVFVKEADSIVHSATYNSCGKVNFAASSPDPGTIYSWEFDNMIATGNNVNYTFNAPGTYFYKLNTLTSGCSQEFNDSIIIPPFQSFSMSIGNDTTVCPGTSLMLTPQLPGNLNDYTYEWKNDTLTAAQRTITVNANTRLILTATDKNTLCTYTDTLDILTFPPVSIQFTPIPAKCEDATEFNLLPYAAPAGGSWSGKGVVNSFLHPELLSAGTHWIYYTYTNVNGCTGFDSVPISIQNKPGVSAGNNIIVCENAASINLSPSLPGGIWSGTAASAVTNNQFNPEVAGPGIFNLIYSISDNVCTSSDTISVEVLAAPPVQFTTIPGICENAFEFDLSSFASPAGGTWSGPGIDNNYLKPELLSTGIYRVYYENTSSNGCTSFDSISINILAKPTITISNDTTICLNDTISVFATGGIHYSWTPANGLSSPASANTLAFPVVTTSYTVTVINNNGCQNTAQLTITVDTCLINVGKKSWERKISIFPNPANESIILQAEDVNIIKVKISNAEGKEINVPNEVINTSWVFSVKELPAGTYFMTIETDKGMVIKKFMKNS